MFFFFLMINKSIKSKQETAKQQQQTQLHAVQVHQCSNYRRRNSSPQVTNIITSSKLGKLMSHPIKVPIQVPNLPASKTIEEIYYTIDNVTESPTVVLR